MDKIKSALGHNVKTLRDQRGLTQVQLAKLAETNPTTISLIESGTVWPIHENIVDIARALKVRETELFADPDYAPSNLEQVDVFKVIGDLGGVPLDILKMLPSANATGLAEVRAVLVGHLRSFRNAGEVGVVPEKQAKPGAPVGHSRKKHNHS